MFGFKKQSTAIIYIMLCVLGEMARTNMINKWIKRSWMGLIVMAQVLSVTTTIYSIHTIHDYSFSQAVFEFMGPNSTFSIFIVYGITLWNRTKLLRLLRVIDEDDVMNTNRTKSDRSMAIKVTCASLIILCLGFILPRPISVHVDRSRSLSQYSYVYPPLLLKYINTLPLYYVSYGLQLLSAAPAVSLWIIYPVFIITIAYELYERFLLLCETCKSIGVYSDLISLYEHDFIADTDRMWMHKKRNMDYEHIRLHLVSCVTRYQKLLATIGCFSSYLESNFTLLLVLNMTGLIPLGYLVIMPGGNLILREVELVLFLFLSLLLFASCYVGKLFEDMNEAMMASIYCIPWYYLPKNLRKLVLILLVQTQRPIHFYALKIYPVSMVTFPNCMKFIYSVVNILRIANL